MTVWDPLCVMVARMSRQSLPWAWIVAASAALVAMADVACASRSFGPVPGPANAAGAVQRSAYRSGRARVVVRSPSSKTVRFDLEPSALYPSPPARLDLVFGRVETGEGLDIQVPPRVGTLRTSAEAVVDLRLRVPSIGVFEGTSMGGECSITLLEVSQSTVKGSFDCRDMHQNVGMGPTVSAAGTFSARG